MTKHNSGVMAGLVPAIHELDEAVVQIIPLGICRENEPYLPGSWPMLHVMFALDGRLNVGIRLHVDKPLQSVSLGEAWQQTVTVFPGTTRYLGSNAGVQDAIWPIGHYVHPRAIHRINVPPDRTRGNEFVDGRDKPGHDDEGAALCNNGGGCRESHWPCFARS